jgi:hypothetical protein
VPLSALIVALILAKVMMMTSTMMIEKVMIVVALVMIDETISCLAFLILNHLCLLLARCWQLVALERFQEE